MSTNVRAQILQATNLVELIGQTVSLKRRGKDFVGLCPFHNEKTPSFHVSPSRGYFNCFGCKAAGTAFDFIMQRDRVDFREAMELLARAANIEIPRFGGEKSKPGERQMLLDLHQAATRFFELQLATPQGGLAREYLAKRGFTDECLKKFRVGMAPPGWDNILRSEVGRKFGVESMVLAGLLKSRDNGPGHYDTFRNRIIFPIRNEAGQIIAFGGRVMPGSEDPAKYLNSPETPLFSKNRTAFGLDFGRQKIVETRTVSVVEGYTDVMMAHQFGASNVVSALGTAFSENHVNILRRFADRIVLLFDADAAGDNAADRVVQLFLTQPVEIAVATMPDGLDPDEYFLKFGSEAFDKMIASAVDAMTYAWNQVLSRLKAAETDLVARERAVRQYLELLSAGAKGGPVDTIRWGTAISQVSRLTGIPVDDLHRRFKPMQSKPKPVYRSDNVSPDNPPAAPVVTGPANGLELAQRQIIGLLLLEPEYWHTVNLSVTIQDFAPGSLRRLAEIYWNHQLDEGLNVLSEFLATLGDPELVKLAIDLVDTVENLPDHRQTLEGAMQFLKEDRLRKEQRQFQAESVEASKASVELQNELLRKLQENARRTDLRRLGS